MSLTFYSRLETTPTIKNNGRSSECSPVKVVLRSFLPSGSPATIWRQTGNKLSTNGLTALTLCKNTESIWLFFSYLPKTQQVISTINYKNSNLLINPYLDSKEPNVMDKFTDWRS